MKLLKLRNLLMLLAIGGLFTFSACDDDDDSDPKPTLNFIGDTTTISPGGNNTVKSGEPIVFSWTVSNGASDLTRFTIDYVAPGGSSQQIFAKTNLADNNATEYAGTFDTTLTQTGEHNFTFRVEEENGNSTERAITVTVEATDQVQTFQQTLLAAPLGSEESKSFYSASDNSTYTKKEADGDQAIQDKIDFGYWYSQDNGAILTNTSDFPAYPNLAWTNTSSAQFGTTNLTVQEFDQITNSDQMIVDNAGNLSSKNATELSADDVVAFETDGGKKGLLKVISVTDGAGQNGQIKFQVKIQK